MAGTGSIAYGRRADGCTARAGGWGYLLGDEGSGYRIALEALQRVARAEDGRGMPTMLTRRLLTHLGLAAASELVPLVYGGRLDRAALAALAPLVLEEAEQGDPVAEAIVRGAAGELADLAGAVVRRLGWENVHVPLVLAGGVLVANAGYRERVVEAVRGWKIVPDPVVVVTEPVQGAVRLALAAWMQRVDDPSR